MLSSDGLSNLLMFFPTARELPPELREEIRQAADPLSLGIGDTLLHQDIIPPAFTVLTSGVLRISRRNGCGRSIMLYRVGPGETCILGASCLVIGRPYPAVATAESVLSGISLPRDFFLHLMRVSEVIRGFVCLMFATRLTTMIELVDDLGFRKVESRLAKSLLSKSYPINVTHQELAGELGSVREVVSRTLKDFESRGLVRLRRGEIYVNDEPGLRQIAGYT